MSIIIVVYEKLCLKCANQSKSSGWGNLPEIGFGDFRSAKSKGFIMEVFIFLFSSRLPILILSYIISDKW